MLRIFFCHVAAGHDSLRSGAEFRQEMQKLGIGHARDDAVVFGAGNQRVQQVLIVLGQHAGPGPARIGNEFRQDAGGVLQPKINLCAVHRRVEHFGSGKIRDSSKESVDPLETRRVARIYYCLLLLCHVSTHRIGAVLEIAFEKGRHGLHKRIGAFCRQERPVLSFLSLLQETTHCTASMTALPKWKVLKLEDSAYVGQSKIISNSYL